MPKLILGVLDVAYSTAHTGDMAKDSQTTTGEVAEKLEKKYQVMETFYNARKEKIAQFLADDMAHSLQDIVRRGKTIKSSGGSTTYQLKQADSYGQYDRRMLSAKTSSLTYGADQRIETEFRKFIFANEMQLMSIGTTGAPISQAAMAGVNHRKKNPYKKRKMRPAFVDTGLYVASMRAWTEK